MQFFVQDDKKIQDELTIQTSDVKFEFTRIDSRTARFLDAKLLENQKLSPKEIIKNFQELSEVLAEDFKGIYVEFGAVTSKELVDSLVKKENLEIYTKNMHHFINLAIEYASDIDRWGHRLIKLADYDPQEVLTDENWIKKHSEWDYVLDNDDELFAEDDPNSWMNEYLKEEDDNE